MGQASLSGGLKVGDTVFYVAPSQALPSGDRLDYGARGEVVGPSGVGDGGDYQRVAVQFPNNTGPVACYYQALSHEPPCPELPGGYRVGDVLAYTGKSVVLADGSKLVSGTTGIVAGPADIPQGVAILFPGNRVPVITTSVQRPLTRDCCLFPFCDINKGRNIAHSNAMTLEVSNDGVGDAVEISESLKAKGGVHNDAEAKNRIRS